MDRVRTRSPVYTRQKSISSSTTSGAPSSPMMSPIRRHTRSGSTGVANFRKTQNNAAKAAAQRLAQVMANQSTEDSDEDDDPSYDYSSSVPSIGLVSGRSMRSPSPHPSPALGRNSTEQPPSQPHSARSTPSGRPLAVKTVPMVPPSVSISLRPPSSMLPTETPRDPRSSMLPTETPRGPRSSIIPTETPKEPRWETPRDLRSSMLQTETPKEPRWETPRDSRKETPRASRRETPRDSRRDKRMSLDLGNLNVREVANDQPASALQDELDMLQEENENILEKLRLAEEKCGETEARARQLEKQAALKAASQTQTHVKSEAVTSLRLEAEAARDEATSAFEQLHEAECEIKSLRTMIQRMVLTKEEMEEVVLKRCWLARYWNLCVQHGVHPEIAGPKYEFWSSLAPLPLEVMLAAGQKAKAEDSTDKTDIQESDRVPPDINDLSGERYIESTLLVEKGLRELASLKVEESIMIAMAQQRRRNILKMDQSVSDDLKLPIENFFEAFELSKEECEDVLFKQAWLTYFWRRAKNHGLEEDIVDERLQFWVNHSTRAPTSHDAVDVERGLIEMKKLGIENQLWQATRKWIDPDGVYTRMKIDTDT